MTDQVKKPGTRCAGLRFTLAPEDSSTRISGQGPAWSQGWQLTKSVFWIAISTITAILIGQL